MNLYYVIALIVFSKSTIAQINITSESVIHPDSNILFVGVDNRIKVSGIKDYEIFSNTSLLYKMGKDEYAIQFSNVGQSIIKLRKKGKSIFAKTFRIQSIPTPQVHLGFIDDTVATIYSILENPFLQIIIPHCDFNHAFTVMSFTLTLLKPNTDSSIRLPSKGSCLSNEQMELIRQQKSGDLICFNEIYATCPDCRLLHFPSFCIKIK